eukprot:NODE_19_length_47148_cov_1.447810.p26 type:complete len:236 gc:universal NODE_19_length_47148_cov_1.447810:12874-12167(-)
MILHSLFTAFALNMQNFNTMLSMVNKLREGLGRKPLTLSSELNDSAQKYSEVQASRNTMGHSVDSTTFEDRIHSARYPGRATAENVGEGYSDVISVVKGWIASPGHFQNLISENSNQVGLGYATSASGVQYWTQDFGYSEYTNKKDVSQKSSSPSPSISLQNAISKVVGKFSDPSQTLHQMIDQTQSDNHEEKTISNPVPSKQKCRRRVAPISQNLPERVPSQSPKFKCRPRRTY